MPLVTLDLYNISDCAAMRKQGLSSIGQLGKRTGGTHHNGLPLCNAGGVRGAAGLVEHGVLHVDKLRPALPCLKFTCILQDASPHQDTVLPLHTENGVRNGMI